MIDLGTEVDNPLAGIVVIRQITLSRLDFYLLQTGLIENIARGRGAAQRSRHLHRPTVGAFHTELRPEHEQQRGRYEQQIHRIEIPKHVNTSCQNKSRQTASPTSRGRKVFV